MARVVTDVRVRFGRLASPAGSPLEIEALWKDSGPVVSLPGCLFSVEYKRMPVGSLYWVCVSVAE